MSLKIEKLYNLTQNSLVSSQVVSAKTFFERSKGLLGQKQLDLDECLWIHNCNSIHTFFMKFAIDVLYVDKNLCVTKIDRNIKPWRLSWGHFHSQSCFEFQSPSLSKNINIGDLLRVSS